MEVAIYLKGGRTIYLENVTKIEHCKTVANEGNVDYIWFNNKYYDPKEIATVKIRLE